MKIGVLFDNFGPYHAARLAGAAERNQIVAIEASPTRSEYEWVRPKLSPDIDYFPLEGSNAAANNARGLSAALDKLFAKKLDAVAIPGWSSYAALALLREAVRRKVPTVLMSETNGWDFERRRVKEMLKRAVVANFRAALVTSNSHRDYLVQLGMPATAIFRGYNAVDNKYFADQAQLRAAGTMPIIGADTVPEGARGRFFLTSNRFIEKKNLPRLLRCYAQFRLGRSDDPADWPLVLLGDGEQRPELEHLRHALNLDSHVLMPGFRQIDELPSFYATAGAFIHASTTEQWGLVVNEAMASGLPVAVSNRCGCTEILVTDGENGFTFDPLDETQIVTALAALANADSAERARMGRASQRRVAEWGPARFGEGLGAAAAHAISAGSAYPDLAARVGLAVATWQRAHDSARLRRAMFSKAV